MNGLYTNWTDCPIRLQKTNKQCCCPLMNCCYMLYVKMCIICAITEFHTCSCLMLAYGWNTLHNHTWRHSIDVHGGSEPDIRRRIEKACSYMKSLDRNIFRQCADQDSTLQCVHIMILPIYYSLRSFHVEYDYGLQSTSRCIWPIWCLRRIVHIP